MTRPRHVQLDAQPELLELALALALALVLVLVLVLALALVGMMSTTILMRSLGC